MRSTIVLPRPVVVVFANKAYLLAAYVAVWILSRSDIDAAAIAAIALGYFHVQYLSRVMA